MNFVSLYPIECEQTELKNMENPFEEQQNQFQRPTFLLVLCILTFIGSGWGTLSNLFSVFTAGLTDSSMQMEHYSSMLNGMDQGGDSAVLSDILSSTMASLQATFVHAKEIAVINLVLSVISLLGAILMFKKCDNCVSFGKSFFKKNIWKLYRNSKCTKNSCNGIMLCYEYNFQHIIYQ